MDSPPNTPHPPQPRQNAWYREAYVWLLIAIPAVALVAGTVTLILAIHGADVELPHPP